MRIPLKPMNPLVRQLVLVGFIAAWVGTILFLLRPWLPSILPPIVRQHYWLLTEAATVTAVICCVAALAVGADLFHREEGGPPTAS